MIHCQHAPAFLRTDFAHAESRPHSAPGRPARTATPQPARRTLERPLDAATRREIDRRTPARLDRHVAPLPPRPVREATCKTAGKATDKATAPSTAKVKLAFHSSVLVATVVESHRLHGRLRPWLEAAAGDELDARISWRAAAEVWLVLTHQPGRTLADADAVLEKLLEHFRPVETSSTIYREALRRCTERGLGYALVDALHLVAAEKISADGFVTLHGAHFEPLCTPSSPKILPPDPPSSSPENATELSTNP